MCEADVFGWRSLICGTRSGAFSPCPSSQFDVPLTVCSGERRLGRSRACLVLLGVREAVEGEVEEHERVPEARARVHELAANVVRVLHDGEEGDASCGRAGGAP